MPSRASSRLSVPDTRFLPMDSGAPPSSSASRVPSPSCTPNASRPGTPQNFDLSGADAQTAAPLAADDVDNLDDRQLLEHILQRHISVSTFCIEVNIGFSSSSNHILTEQQLRYDEEVAQQEKLDSFKQLLLKQSTDRIEMHEKLDRALEQFKGFEAALITRFEELIGQFTERSETQRILASGELELLRSAAKSQLAELAQRLAVEHRSAAEFAFNEDSVSFAVECTQKACMRLLEQTYAQPRRAAAQPPPPQSTIRVSQP